MDHHTIRGRLRYTSKKPHMLDRVRGGEDFTITLHPDGRRALRAHCAIDEDSPRVLRDVVLNVDGEWRPASAFVQISIDDRFAGSAWYRFTPDAAECEGFTVAEGRISERRRLDGPTGFFGTHPIQADAWLTAKYDLSRGPGVQIVPSFLMCSLHHRGADGPALLTHPDLELYFVGRERVSVEAGTFDALHFRIGENEDDEYMGTDRHPPYHTWVTSDGSYVVLKAHCTGYMQTYYELVEYDRRAGFR